jgi:ATP-binding cassette, subfamily B, bacterial MsbA
MHAASWPLLKRVAREFLRPYWRAILIVMACTLLIAITASLYPIVIKWTFDGLEARDKSILALAPFAVIAATLLKGLSAMAQIIATNRTVTRIEVAMQDRLFRHLIGSDVLTLAQDRSGDILQRFNGDIGKIRTLITHLVTVILKDIATTIGILGWMLYSDWQLTLMLLVLIPFVIIPTRWIGNKMRSISRAAAEASGQNTSAIIEALETPRIAKLYQLEDYLTGRASERFQVIRRFNVRAANLSSVMRPTMEAVGGLAVAGVLVLVGWRIVNGSTSVGDFIAFITGLIMASQPISAISHFHVVVQEALASVERYYRIIDQMPKVTDHADARPLALTRGAIGIENLSFAYRDDQPTLTDLSFMIEGGTICALVGRSGSGKSTLFGLLPRLFDPSAGRIQIDGQDTRHVTLASLRASMAFVSQDAVLYDDTIAANIGFGKPGSGMDAIREAAKAAAAHDFIMGFPEGYETPVGARGERLSGGQRQRIAIARAFLKDAPIVCLDEATSALDSESEAAIQSAMKRLMQGRTVLIIAHRLSTIRDADRIVVLDQGRLAETGSHAELIAAKGIYAGLHALQFSQGAMRAAE